MSDRTKNPLPSETWRPPASSVAISTTEGNVLSAISRAVWALTGEQRVTASAATTRLCHSVRRLIGQIGGIAAPGGREDRNRHLGFFPGNPRQPVSSVRGSKERRNQFSKVAVWGRG